MTVVHSYFYIAVYTQRGRRTLEINQYPFFLNFCAGETLYSFNGYKLLGPGVV